MATPNPNRIPLLATAFVSYTHADLPTARTFLLDFGLTIARETPKEIFFKGYGSEPIIYIARQSDTGTSSFCGAAYTVPSRADLEAATKRIQGCSAIAPLDAPGGGEYVQATDPAGHSVFLVHGQRMNDSSGEERNDEKAQTPPPEITQHQLVTNYEFPNQKPRKGVFHRFTPGPAPVHRWGHYGVTYPPGTYETMYTWYTTHLSLAPSDIVYKDGKPLTCFFHIDRGLEFTDHHAFFFKPAKEGQKPSVAHAAFETHDFDVQQLGHDWLTSKGYEVCWGVGRHVLGSQVFDYWFDPSRFILEHYSDGDLVNSESKVSHVPAGPQALKIWGPPVPEVF
ncbi:Glyoxalase/Bleomycin resistance protein/Dihydroxybiphenyl dioxygenase [Paraphoma chrysanthemicola]|nr:Glyoxalase/Bleomycin resistance protein/Dihydroxybiphenyl dioxygenase [Paraphoma chrysanthemicola]